MILRIPYRVTRTSQSKSNVSENQKVNVKDRNAKGDEKDAKVEEKNVS